MGCVKHVHIFFAQEKHDQKFYYTHSRFSSICIKTKDSNARNTFPVLSRGCRVVGHLMVAVWHWLHEHQQDLQLEHEIGYQLDIYLENYQSHMPWIQPLLAHCGGAKMAAILADTIFNCISFNDNIWILKEISLKYPIDNMAALVQITNIL